MWQVLLTPLVIFLDLDNYTKACASLKYARACVEVDVAKPIPGEVTIVLSDGRKFCQKVEVEGNMAYCAFCKIHGHSLMDCRKKGKNLMLDPKAISITIQGDGSENGKKSDVKDSQEGWTEVKTKKKNRKVNFTSIHKEKQDNEEKLLEPLDNNDVLKSGNNENENDNNEDEDVLEGELLPELHNDDNTKEVVDDMRLVVYTRDKAGESAHGEEREQDNGSSVGVVISTVPNSSTERFEDHVLYTRDDGSIYCEELGGKSFQDMEELVKFAKENGYVVQEVSCIPIEESGKGFEDHEVTHNSDNESCDQVDYVDPSRIPIISSQQRIRHRKKKGSRSSARSCPKKKDTNFVWP